MSSCAPLGAWIAHRPKPSTKGTGFVQPLGPHRHWHIDIPVITIPGRYYYLCSVLDGYSRAIVHWDFLDRMTEAYKSEYANVHRGLHYLANAATEAYEGGRAKVAKFLNAARQTPAARGG